MAAVEPPTIGVVANAFFNASSAAHPFLPFLLDSPLSLASLVPLFCSSAGDLSSMAWSSSFNPASPSAAASD